MQSTPEEPAIILLISHVVPVPPSAGNEIRILKMMRWLRSQGHRVVLLLNHPALTAERAAQLEALAERVHFVDDDLGASPPALARRPADRLRRWLAAWLPDSALYRALFGMGKPQRTSSDSVKRGLAPDRLIQATRHLCERYAPDAVLAEYVFAAPCLDVVPPGALRIIDTHDMFSRKKEQVLAWGIDDPLPCTPREERRYLLACDLAIAIQPNEARLFRELVPERKVITVGIDFEVVPEVDPDAAVPGRVLVVGSDNPLNVHGLLEFHAHAWPAIRAARPEASLRVVGKLANRLEVDDPRVERVGWVPDLDQEYREAAVVLNPTLAGTGLKIKSVEALCRAKALVGTPNSVEGIEAEGDPPFVVGRDWEAFAEAVVELLGSPGQRHALEQRAWRFARESFSTERVYAPLEHELELHLRKVRAARGQGRSDR